MASDNGLSRREELLAVATKLFAARGYHGTRMDDVADVIQQVFERNGINIVSKARAEKLVMASGLDWTIVRPPGIYGPRDTEYLEMFRLARWGLLPVPLREGRSSLIHVDDLARLLLALLPASEEVSHRVYEPDDGRKQGWSHYELARAIGWAVGRRPWVIHLSRPALERIARADRFVRKHRAKLTLDRVGYMSHPDWVVTHGARPPSSLWRPLIATREGLKATAQWYRDNKWL